MSDVSEPQNEPTRPIWEPPPATGQPPARPYWQPPGGEPASPHRPPPGGQVGPPPPAPAGVPPTGPHPGSPTPPARSGRDPFVRTVAVAVAAGVIGAGLAAGGTYLLTNDSTAAPALSATPVVTQSASTAVSAKPGSVEYAAHLAGRSTVDIKVASANGAGDEGSGIVLTKSGYILTNNHVVAAATGGGTMRVTLPDGSVRSARLVGASPSYDLAVIQVENATGLVPAQLGNSSSVRVGEEVAALGSPFGYQGTVTAGIISTLSRTVTVQSDNGQLVVYSALQTDAPINSGNSGGPLVNMAGQVVGVDSAISTGNTMSASGQAGSIGIGFAIPVNTASRIANELIEHGFATKPVLGVTGDPATTTTDGAHIAKVTSGTAAARAGLKAGDVIAAIDGTRIGNYADLMAQILDYTPGQTVQLTVSNGSGAHTLTATLGSEQDHG
ncbi:MAG: S1C family serine protease [Nocardioidaceae bacterium]